MNLVKHAERFLQEKGTQNKATVSNLYRVVAFYTRHDTIVSDNVMDYIIQRRKDEAKPATINRELTISKQFFAWLHTKGYILQDPTEGIPYEKLSEQRSRWLTTEEEASLILSSPSWLGTIIQFATATGMRRGEILPLQKSQVDFKLNIVYLLKTKNGLPRAIPLTPRAIEAVNKSNGSAIVFPNPRGFQVNPSALEYEFKKAVDRAGLINVHFHDLRHTFATRLVQKGVDIYAVQRLLGHKSPAMTQRYSHHSIESLRRAVEMV